MVAKDNSNRAKKPAIEILDQVVEEGLAEHERPNFGLFISALTAGLDIGFSFFMMAVAYTMFSDMVSEPVMRLILANLYSIGFLFVVLGRSELYTEHTTVAFFPVLDKKASANSLVQLLLVVLIGNLTGTLVSALFISRVGPLLGVIEPGSIVSITEKIVEPSWNIIFASAILAGWLMGLLAWVITASRDTTAQIIIVWIVTASIGLAGLHHSIVGAVEVFSAMYSSSRFGWNLFLKFITAAVLGNTVGGAFFVAFFKYNHARIQGRLPS